MSRAVPYTYTVVDTQTNEVIAESKNKDELKEMGIHNPYLYVEGKLYKRRYSITEDISQPRVELSYKASQELLDDVADVLKAAKLIREGKARIIKIMIKGKWVKRTVPYGM